MNTGKQTIYQCIELAQRISALGGSAKRPAGIQGRIRAQAAACGGRAAHRPCQQRRLRPADWLVPGSQQLLAMLRRRGVTVSRQRHRTTST